jgi:DNA-binding NtrC family response regulator
MKSQTLIGEAEVKLLSEAAFAFDWTKDVKPLDREQTVNVALFHFFFSHRLEEAGGLEATIAAVPTLVPFMLSSPQNINTTDFEAAIAEKRGAIDLATASPADLVPIFGPLLGDQLARMGGGILGDDFAQIAKGPMLPNILNHVLRHTFGAADTGFDKRKLGFFYVRLLLDGQDLLDTFAKEIPKLNLLPGMESAFSPAGVLNILPELKLSPEQRFVPLHACVARILDGWKQKSKSLAQMGCSGQRLALRLGHEAMTAEPVLLLGETGTGKELAARVVHELSPRRELPFVPVNCGGLPDDLACSLLFGHCKGAFTGATSDSKGAFLAAAGGTVFLDEIGDLSLRNQALLLRALGEKRVVPLGATQEMDVDFRLVAATNRDIETMVEKHEFRADLYFRLRGDWAVRLPSLKERSDAELEATWLALVREASQALGIPDKKRPLRAPDLAAIRARSWGGNVRQLSTFARKYVECMAGKAFASDLASFFEYVDLAFKPTSPSGRGKWPSRESVNCGIAAASERGINRTLGELREAIVLACIAQEGENSRAAVRLGMTESALRTYVSRKRKKDEKRAQKSPTGGSTKD